MSESQYLTVPEAAVTLGISQQRLRLLLQGGRIRGAQRVGRFWQIPAPPEIIPFLEAETGLAKELVSAARVAGSLGFSREYVSDLCRKGRIRGAVKVGKHWAIPLPVEILPGEPRGRPRSGGGDDTS